MTSRRRGLHDRTRSRTPTTPVPGPSSWREVTVTAIDDQTVQFDLADPVGGFLQAATQPLLPDHLLHDVAPPTSPRIAVQRRTRRQRAVPARDAGTRSQAHLECDRADRPPPSSDRVAIAVRRRRRRRGAVLGRRLDVRRRPQPRRPRRRPVRRPRPRRRRPPPRRPPVGSVRPEADRHPLLQRRGLAHGRLPAPASSTPPVGLMSADATPARSTPGSRLIEYPRTTFTGIVLNLRPGPPALPGRAVRDGAPRGAIDRAEPHRRPPRRRRHAGRHADPAFLVGLRREGRAGGRLRPGRRDEGLSRRPAGRCVDGAWSRAERRSSRSASSSSRRTRTRTRPSSTRRPRPSPPPGRRFGINVTVIALTPQRLRRRAPRPGVDSMRRSSTSTSASTPTSTRSSPRPRRRPAARTSPASRTPDLDKKLVGGPALRVARRRDWRPSGTSRRYLGEAELTLPLFFRDRAVRARGPGLRTDRPGDRRSGWSILGRANMAPRRRPVTVVRAVRDGSAPRWRNW